MNSDLDTLAEVYLRHCSTQNDDDFWAWERVCDIIEHGSVDQGWDITLLLLRKAENDHELGCVAAGPLEDLIDIHGHDALDRIEEAAKTDPRIQFALSQVGVLYYYNEFDRWYELLYSYGLKTERVADKATVESAMSFMDAYVGNRIDVREYGRNMYQLLDKPLEDKRAQRVLQALMDEELLDAELPPELRRPRLSEPELKERVARGLAELNSLRYETDRDLP